MRRQVSRIALPALVLLLSAQPASSDVDPPPPPTNKLYGFVNSNTTLTLAAPGPVYYVVGDLIINPGVTLTVEPGVTVRFAANRDTLGGGDYPGLTELRVRGHLVAQGTVADSIRFLSTNDGFAEWGQIRVEAGADLVLRHVVLKGAQVGLNYLSPSPLVVADMLVKDCSVAMYVLDGTLTARWITAVNCTHGLLIGAVTGSIQTCSLSGTGSGTGLSIGPGIDTTPPDTGTVVPTVVSGFAFGVVASSASIRNIVALRNGVGFRGDAPSAITYCTAAQNGTGFEVWGSLTNSIAASNSTGIRNNPCLAAVVDFVDSWANGSNLVNNCGSISVSHYESFNPFFLNPSVDDFRLGEGSIFESFGSTGGQIGAYGPHRGPNVVAVMEPGSGARRIAVSVAPNPTRGLTRFACQLPGAGAVTAEIIDLSGRRVRHLTSSARGAGLTTITWDGSDESGASATPGLYYWRVTSGADLATGRVVVVK